MYLFTSAFWRYCFERAIKTAAQSLIAGITVSSFIPTNGNAWVAVASVAGVATLVSVLTSLVAYSAASGSEATPTGTDSFGPR
jgi:hypothetical protein